MGDRLAELQKQQELLEARLSKAPPSTVRLHPRLAEAYAQKVQHLETALNDPTIRAEAAEVLRSLINRIELRPRGNGQGIAATLHGDLAQILALCDNSGRKQKLPKAEASGSQLSVVAGVGFIQERTMREQEGRLRLVAEALQITLPNSKLNRILKRAALNVAEAGMSRPLAFDLRGGWQPQRSYRDSARGSGAARKNKGP